jgi:hypothetical protein
MQMRTFLILLGLVVIAVPADAQHRYQAAATTALRQAPPITVMSENSPLRFLAPDCDLDRTRGREAASANHNGSGWMIGGLASGVLLGLIGTAISYAIASGSTPEVNRIPEGVEAACYRDGYMSKAKSMNTSNALTGGLLGTAILVLIVVSASSGSSY